MVSDTTEGLALLAAATRGPWEWVGDSFDDEPHVCPHGESWCDHGPDLETVAKLPAWDDGSISPKVNVLSAFGYDASGVNIKSADANLIVYLVNNAPAMFDALDTIERARRIHWHDGGRAVSGCDADGCAYPCPTIRALDGDRDD
jgi:hypothetical protein